METEHMITFYCYVEYMIKPLNTVPYCNVLLRSRLLAILLAKGYTHRTGSKTLLNRYSLYIIFSWLLLCKLKKNLLCFIQQTLDITFIIQKIAQPVLKIRKILSKLILEIAWNHCVLGEELNSILKLL